MDIPTDVPMALRPSQRAVRHAVRAQRHGTRGRDAGWESEMLPPVCSTSAINRHHWELQISRLVFLQEGARVLRAESRQPETLPVLPSGSLRKPGSFRASLRRAVPSNHVCRLLACKLQERVLAPGQRKPIFCKNIIASILQCWKTLG